MAILAGIVGGVVQQCEAQQVEIDTTTEQYHVRRTFVDSLARYPLSRWAKTLKLTGWRIVLQADTLAEATAQTHLREAYRTALIIVDLRRLEWPLIDEVILHELWHIRLSGYTTTVRMVTGAQDGPIAWMLSQQEEALVTDLTRGMLWR
jgi:hypothetical protein